MATLDQSFTANDYSIGIGAASEKWYAQQIVIGQAGVLDSVELYLKNNSSYTGTAYIYIYSDLSDSPNSAISDAQSIDISTLTNSLTWKTFVFGTKPAIAVNDKVWVVINFYNAGNNFLNWGAYGAGGYAGVDVKYSADGLSWTTAGGGDANFKQYYNVSGPANVKSKDGLAIASIKSINGLAIASIKSINGLS